MTDKKKKTAARGSGTQTLERGLDILDVVAEGRVGATDISRRLNLSKSTVHRLASALVARRFLKYAPHEGYSLGPKLMNLGFKAHRTIDLVQIARPHLEQLAKTCGDTVHLAVLEGPRVLYLDKVQGERPLTVRSRVGERHPIPLTGAGRAMILFERWERWRDCYQYEVSQGRVEASQAEAFLASMSENARRGYVLDHDAPNHIRRIAVPIIGADGSVVAALSVSCADQHMDDLRSRRVAADSRKAAQEISQELGFLKKPDEELPGTVRER